ELGVRDEERELGLDDRNAVRDVPAKVHPELPRLLYVDLVLAHSGSSLRLSCAAAMARSMSAGVCAYMMFVEPGCHSTRRFAMPAAKSFSCAGLLNLIR